MTFEALSILSERWFVVPWYVIGAVGAVWVARDAPRMRWAWCFVVLMLSVVGLALYAAAGRARSVPTAVRAVAGHGLGIVVALVVTRAIRMSYWPEFWIALGAGLLTGFAGELAARWRIATSTGEAIASAFRTALLSILTVMGGVGAVTAYVTPMTVTAQPGPLTYAFWGFLALGLLAGFVLTYPTSYLLTRLRWTRAPGRGERLVGIERRGARFALGGAAIGLAAAALVLPAWGAQARRAAHVGELDASIPTAVRGVVILREGLRADLDVAARALETGDRRRAALAIDAALRAAEVGAHVAPDGFYRAWEDVQRARHALWMGSPGDARAHLLGARTDLRDVELPRTVPPSRLERYAGAHVLDARGEEIGAISRILPGERVEVGLGGVRDVWGAFDLGTPPTIEVSAHALLFGPERGVGWTYVVLPGG